ncbi:MAG: GAF domain-containing protein [Thermodesulfobacteria bacterium]|nr:GAF domain-containing protein [Thermodesulfobacteriota bacterium]
MTRPSLLSPLDHLLRAVADSLDAHTSALFIRVPKGRLRLEAWHSLSDCIDEAAEIEIGHGPVGWVMREQRPLNIARFKQDSRIIGLYRDDVGIKSFLAVPLPEDAGVIMVDSKTRLKFTDKHLNIMMSFAQCVMQLLNVSRLEAENRLLLKLLRWDASFDSDFIQGLKGSMKVLSFNICLVLRRVQEKNFFTVESVVTAGNEKCPDCDKVAGKRFPLAEGGVCGWIFRHCEGLFLKDFGADPERRVLLAKDEELGPKNTVLGLFFPASPKDVFRIDHALVFAGDVHTDAWPQGLPEILKQRLERMVPWR